MDPRHTPQLKLAGRPTEEGPMRTLVLVGVVWGMAVTAAAEARDYCPPLRWEGATVYDCRGPAVTFVATADRRSVIAYDHAARTAVVVEVGALPPAIGNALLWQLLAVPTGPTVVPAGSWLCTAGECQWMP